MRSTSRLWWLKNTLLAGLSPSCRKSDAVLRVLRRKHLLRGSTVLSYCVLPPVHFGQDLVYSGITNNYLIICFLAVSRTITFLFFYGAYGVNRWQKTLQTKLTSRNMQMFLCFFMNMLKQSIRWSQKAESGLKTR